MKKLQEPKFFLLCCLLALATMSTMICCTPIRQAMGPKKACGDYGKWEAKTKFRG